LFINNQMRSDRAVAPGTGAERDRLYEQLSAVGDFRRGSVSENYRK